MIIDTHAHLWDENYIEDKKIILKVLDTFNIDKIYISTLQVYYPSMEDVKRYNNKTYEFMQEDSRVGGFIYVDPTHDNCMEVLKEGVKRKMAGIKLWVSCFCDDKRVDRVAKFCIDNNLPMLVHAFKKSTGQLPYETTAMNVRNLASRHPKLNIIMAHLGGNCYDGIRCIEDLNNVYTDFSGTIYRSDDLAYTIDLIGEDRVLYGSDLPTGCMQCIGQVEGGNFTKEQKEKIYYKNALKILGDR